MKTGLEAVRACSKLFHDEKLQGLRKGYPSNISREQFDRIRPLMAGLARRLSQMAHRSLVLEHLERAAQGRQPTGAGLRACSKSSGPYRQESQRNCMRFESALTVLAQPASFLLPCQAAFPPAFGYGPEGVQRAPVGNPLHHLPSPRSPGFSRTPCAKGLSVSPPSHGGRSIHLKLSLTRSVRQAPPHAAV